VEAFQTIDLERIIPSPTNPRKVFDPDRLQELADSIKAEGLLQPIVVRPAPDFELVPGRMSGKEGFLWESRARSVLGGFAKRREDADAVRPLEIVVGERRYRAAKLAGLEAIPAVVRDLTDVQVLEAQVVENAQRENVLPSEQAAGCRAVVKALGAEKAAARLGKSVTWVRGFLLLESCPEDLLAAVDAGKVGRTVAELVCRLPRHEQQDLAARCVLAGATNPDQLSTRPNAGAYLGEVLGYRQTKELVATHFQRELKGAPFDQKDKRLVPNATSCKACPERAGNAKAVDPEAYADTRDDVCLNPACYREKCEAQKLRDTLKARSAPPPASPATNGRTPLPTVQRPNLNEWMASAKAASPDPPGTAAIDARPPAGPPEAAVAKLGEVLSEWCLDYIGDPFARDRPSTSEEAGPEVFMVIAGGLLAKWDRKDVGKLVALMFAESAKRAARAAGNDDSARRRPSANGHAGNGKPKKRQPAGV
jgi:ParB/RepB/Spo0J family partition protein